MRATDDVEYLIIGMAKVVNATIIIIVVQGSRRKASVDTLDINVKSLSSRMTSVTKQMFQSTCQGKRIPKR